jgi:hypothetical protein
MLKEIRFFQKIGFLGRNKNGVKNKPQKRFKFNTLDQVHDFSQI